MSNSMEDWTAGSLASSLTKAEFLFLPALCFRQPSCVCLAVRLVDPLEFSQLVSLASRFADRRVKLRLDLSHMAPLLLDLLVGLQDLPL